MSKDDNKAELSLTVGTPKGPLEVTIAKTATAAELITFCIGQLGLGGSSDAFQLFRTEDGRKQELQPTNRPLVSFGLADGDKLLLAAIGSGV